MGKTVGDIHDTPRLAQSREAELAVPLSTVTVVALLPHYPQRQAAKTCAVVVMGSMPRSRHCPASVAPPAVALSPCDFSLDIVRGIRLTDVRVADCKCAAQDGSADVVALKLLKPHWTTLDRQHWLELGLRLRRAAIQILPGRKDSSAAGRCSPLRGEIITIREVEDADMMRDKLDSKLDSKQAVNRTTFSCSSMIHPYLRRLILEAGQLHEGCGDKANATE